MDKDKKEYDDIRPLIVTTVDGLNSALKLIANTFGVPADWVNARLERFREKIRNRVEAIPNEHLQEPAFRLTYKVLREVVISVEEPTLQELFANLLAGASDTRTSADAHPSFVEIVPQLTPFDAVVIEKLFTDRCIHFYAVEEIWPDDDGSFYVSSYNLCRLGLAEWKTQQLDSFASSRAADGFKRVRGTSVSTLRIARDSPGAYADAAEELAKEIIDAMHKTQQHIGIRLTGYGILFACACMGKTFTGGEIDE